MQGDSDTITQLAVVILLLGMAVPTLGVAYSDSSTPTQYSESAVVDYTADYNLNETATDEGYGNIEITVDDQQLVEGTDFRFDSTAGSVEWTNTTNTSAGDTASIDYTAAQRTVETETAYQILAPLMSLFGVFALVTAVRVLWGYVAEIWEATA